MLIKELRLHNFLSFKDSGVISLGNLNVLIGPNGSGKSNLIEAIDLLHNAPVELTKPVREGGGVYDWIYKGVQGRGRANLNAVVDYPGHQINGIRYVLAFSAVNQRFEICDERIETAKPVDSSHKDPYFYYRFNNGNPFINIIEKDGGSRRRELKSEEIDLEKSVSSQRKDPDQYPEITYIGNAFSQIKLYREWSTGRYTMPRLPQKADLPNKYLQEDYSNLGLVLNRMRRDNQVKQHIIRVLNSLNPGVSDFDVQIEGGTVQVFLTENGFSIPATRLSDGTLRFLCLAAILLNIDLPPLICIEEPEIGLHPDVIGEIAEMLKIAAERSQVIVTTHSDKLVDALSDTPDSVIVSENRDGNSVMNRLDGESLSSWLEKYSLGKLWMSGEIGGTRW